MNSAPPAFSFFSLAFALLFSVLLVSCGGSSKSDEEDVLACTPSGDSECTRTVFVTDAIMVGDFAAGSAIGALAEADAICQGEANSAGLSGTYFAWISVDPANSPASMFTQSTDPYVLPTGDVVADNWADLTDGTLQTPINLNASGGTPAGNCATTMVFTGTTASGTSTGINCAGWTAPSGVGTTRGILGDSTSWWTEFPTLASCNFTKICGGTDVGGRLYCFEQ